MELNSDLKYLSAKASSHHLKLEYRIAGKFGKDSVVGSFVCFQFSSDFNFLLLYIGDLMVTFALIPTEHSQSVYHFCYVFAVHRSQNVYYICICLLNYVMCLLFMFPKMYTITIVFALCTRVSLVYVLFCLSVL